MPESWTTEDIPDQSEKTIVVTGANSGLGLEATRAFVESGAHVVMACRNMDDGRTVKQRLQSAGYSGSLDLFELDLADLDSVQEFADALRTRYTAIDTLCNNAGVMAIPRRESVDGFEMQFAVNHLSHFALTGLIFDCLRQGGTPAQPARVVTTSAGFHEIGEIKFDDLQSEREYGRLSAYAQSKLANLLFAYELDRRARASDEPVRSIAAHPGYTATNLTRWERGSLLTAVMNAVFRVGNALVAQSTERGVLPLLFAATSPEAEDGGYYGPDGLGGLRGYPEKQRSSERSYDERLAARLWMVSEDLTGVNYDLPTPRAGTSDPSS
jgi:NAD(P)-dependent dehydrogenase (short-subunit alcohol dehydrogenase family)